MGVVEPTPIELPEIPSSPIQPQAVLEQQLCKGTPEVLVHWMGYSPADASWEKKTDFNSRFLDFILEDKNDFMGGGMLRSSHK